ncbi:SMI1/KNR4 family protein, partial [Niallia sp. SS-2023]|nr:SMI1/KNR4 family protein [Niallia sp. SS-2023]
YVAIDLDNCTDDTATLWFTHDQPEYNLSFWDVVDEWIVIGMQDI